MKQHKLKQYKVKFHNKQRRKKDRKENKKIKRLASLFVIVLTAIGFATFTSTETSADTSAEQLLVDVTPVFPDNQDPEVGNYLSLRAEETHFKQEVEFIVSNRSEEEVTIQMEALNALNSPQKGIQYTPNTAEGNTHLLDERYALANYMDMEEEITLAGGETKTIQTNIDIPELEGTMLGAISFQTLAEDEEENDDPLMIHTELNRIIGLQINMETDAEAEFVVHDPYIDPMSAYFVIRLPIELPSSLLMQDVSLAYDVVDDEGHLLFDSKEEAPFNIAPNTHTAFALPWQHDTVEENKEYEIQGALKYEGRTLEFSKVFDYNEANFAQNQANSGSTGQPEIIKDSLSYVWLALIALLVVLGGGAIVYRRNQLKKKRLEEMN